MRERSLSTLLVIGMLVLAILNLGMGDFRSSSEIPPDMIFPQHTYNPPTFGPVLFATDFDDKAQIPIDVNRTFSAKTAGLYAYWAYSGVEANMPFTYEWYRNGEFFSGGQDTFKYATGYSWQRITGEGGWPLQAGIYEFVAKLEDKVVLHDQCIIAGPYMQGTSAPAFTYITFGSGLNEQTQQPYNVDSAFPYGITRLYAEWPYSGVRPGEIFTYEWLLNGEPLTGGENSFDGPSGFFWTSIFYDEDTPLGPGTYQLMVRVGGEKVIHRDDFCLIEINHLACGPVAFSSRFDDNLQEPADARSSFPTDITHLYAYWPYNGVRVGDTFTCEWNHNGEPFHSSQGQFDQDNGYSWQWIYHADGKPLEPGIYQFIVKINGQTVLAGQTFIEDHGLGPETSAAASAHPTFSPIVFCSVFDDIAQKPLNPRQVFQYGITKLYGYWHYEGVRTGDTFQYEWYRNEDGLEGYDSTFEYTSGPAWQQLTNPDGSALDPGAYKPIIKINGKAVLAGECLIEFV